MWICSPHASPGTSNSAMLCWKLQPTKLLWRCWPNLPHSSQRSHNDQTGTWAQESTAHCVFGPHSGSRPSSSVFEGAKRSPSPGESLNHSLLFPKTRRVSTRANRQPGRPHSLNTRTLTPQELDASCHPAHSPGDELGHTAAHERCQGHQEEQPAAQARHHRADPPLGARDGLEGGVAATALHHHGRLAALIPHRVGTPPESAEGNRLLQLRPQEPVGHEEANAGGGSAEEGEEGPHDASTGEARSHLCICSKTPHDGKTQKQLCILKELYG